MEIVETMSPDKLWDQVEDMMEYFGCWDNRLRKCRLENGCRRNAFVLQVPEDLIGLIADGVDDIEDALEQVLGEHQVDVYVRVMKVDERADLKADELMCRQLADNRSDANGIRLRRKSC